MGFRPMALLGLMGASWGKDWIDRTTPSSALHTTSRYPHGRESSAIHALVFSDEFSLDGRSFDDGHDPRWTAINKDDYTNNALQ